MDWEKSSAHLIYKNLTWKCQQNLNETLQHFVFAADFSKKVCWFTNQIFVAAESHVDSMSFITTHDHLILLFIFQETLYNDICYTVGDVLTQWVPIENFQIHFWKQKFDLMRTPLYKKSTSLLSGTKDLQCKCIANSLWWTFFPSHHCSLLNPVFVLFFIFWSNCSCDLKLEQTAPHICGCLVGVCCNNKARASLEHTVLGELPPVMISIFNCRDHMSKEKRSRA